MRDAGISTTKFVYFNKQEWQTHQPSVIQKITQSLKFPVMVKPAHLGSSIGIGKARDQKELVQKVEVAMYYDNKIVVEEMVENLMDVTCCLIGNDSFSSEEHSGDTGSILKSATSDFGWINNTGFNHIFIHAGRGIISHSSSPSFFVVSFLIIEN
jgi:D-alanine-D-alanine ligase-like ATP-grasp enzyme